MKIKKSFIVHLTVNVLNFFASRSVRRSKIVQMR